MGILVSSAPFEGSRRIGSLYCTSAMKNIGGFLVFIHGSVFSPSERELVAAVSSGDVDALSRSVGEYAVVILDPRTERVQIANDKCGRQLIFYSNERLVVSSDFWSIVSHLGLNSADLDVEALREYVFLFTTYEGKTIMKNLRILENASLVSLHGDCHSVNVSLSKYWEFHAKSKRANEDEKIEQYHRAIRQSIERVVDDNDENTVYGLGLSGGLDSRVILQHLVEIGVEPELFIIGRARPNRLLLSNDHHIAQQLADHFQKKLNFKDSQRLSVLKQMDYDCIQNPMGTSQLFKVVQTSDLEHEILVTGASGTIIGASPLYSSILGKQGADVVRNKLSALSMVHPRRRKRQIVNLLTNMTLREHLGHNALKPVLDRADETTLMKTIEDKIREYHGDSIVDTLMNVTLSTLSQKNMAGGFESLLGAKKAFSPYTLDTLDFVETLEEKDILDRALFVKYINQKFPHFAAIPGQDHKLASSSANLYALRILLRGAEFAVRGAGVMDYGRLLRKRDVFEKLSAIVRRSEVLKGVFHVEPILEAYHQGLLHYSVLPALAKVGRILELIESTPDRKRIESEGRSMIDTAPRTGPIS